MSWLSRLVNTFRGSRVDRDLDEELRFHLDERTGDLMRRGLDRDEATARAGRELGAPLRHREASRDVKLLPWLESVWQDLWYATRSLRRSPGFTSAALIALVIAIGLNTSLFTIFNALALKPWPVADPGRVVTIFNVRSAERGSTTGFSLAEYRYLREHARTMSGLMAWRQGAVRLGHEEAGAVTFLQYVSGNYFDVLGVDFALGRGFAPDEDTRRSPQTVAVLRHSFWVRQFGADPGVLGRSIRIDDVPFTVIGVAAPEFAGTAPEPYELWIPLATLPVLKPEGTWAMEVLEKPAHCCSAIAGRLAEGVTRAEAQADLELLHRRFAASVGTETNGVHVGGTALLSQSSDNRREFSGVLALMFSAVTLVLLLACANVGNLMLARALARQQEMGIRLSIGASRLRLIRQLLTEGLVLAVLAGGLGLLAASVLPSWLLRAVLGEETSMSLAPDVTVLAYTTLLCVVTCVLSGLAPALKTTRLGGTAIHRARPRMRFVSLRGVLLSTQLAVSVVLLVGASLLVRGVQHARAIDPGFQVDGVAVVSVALPARAYDTVRARTLLYDVIAAMRETPGFGPAGLTANVPLGRVESAGGVRRAGESEDARQMIQVQEVSSGYFEVLQIPIVAGRAFTDQAADRPFVLVNESLARHFWPGENPVGRVLVTSQPREVVGVVKDTHVSGLNRVEPMFYTSFSGGLSPRILVRHLDAAAVGRLTTLMARLDPRVTIQVKPLTWYADRWLAPSRVGASLASVVGMLALCLATIGVFGVFAYMVEERRREIGIRMAVGARTRHIMTLVIGSAGPAVGVGLTVGLAATYFVTQFLQAYLFGVSRFDGVAYAAVAALLALAAMIASYVPAMRASRIDPVAAIRCE